MTYHPPFARMRQIKRDTVRPERDPAPVPTPEPANVSEALAQTPPETVYVIEEPTPPEPEVVERAVLVPPEAPEPEVAEPVETKAKFNPQMKKSELVVIAANLGIPISDEMTKAQILDALKAAGH